MRSELCAGMRALCPLTQKTNLRTMGALPRGNCGDSNQLACARLESTRVRRNRSAIGAGRGAPRRIARLQHGGESMAVGARQKELEGQEHERQSQTRGSEEG